MVVVIKFPDLTEWVVKVVEDFLWVRDVIHTH